MKRLAAAMMLAACGPPAEIDGAPDRSPPPLPAPANEPSKPDATEATPEVDRAELVPPTPVGASPEALDRCDEDAAPAPREASCIDECAAIVRGYVEPVGTRWVSRTDSAVYTQIPRGDLGIIARHRVVTIEDVLLGSVDGLETRKDERGRTVVDSFRDGGSLPYPPPDASKPGAPKKRTRLSELVMHVDPPLGLGCQILRLHRWKTDRWWPGVRVIQSDRTD